MTSPVVSSRLSPVVLPSTPSEAPVASSATATPTVDEFAPQAGSKPVDLGGATDSNFNRLAGLDLGYDDDLIPPDVYGPTRLDTTPEQARLIAQGKHQIWDVEGKRLREPSQNIDMIESRSPFKPGQTHTKTKHVGQTLQDNIDRLNKERKIAAAGGFYDVKSGQRAVNGTVANPANQRFIADFLADDGRTKDVLYRVDLGEPVGTNTLRSDLEAGKPCLRPASTATVVLIKDDTFPEGYRILTAYPEATSKPEVDANGEPL